VDHLPHIIEGVDGGVTVHGMTQLILILGVSELKYGLHLTRLIATHAGSLFSTTTGGRVSLGGTHPYLRHVACTSAPLVHLKSG
jgi:hypothetical protein